MKAARFLRCRRFRTCGLWRGLLLLSAPVWYALSVGPAAFLIMFFDEVHPYFPETGFEDFIETFYAPLTWLHENTLLREPLEIYAKLWGEFGESVGEWINSIS